jgi:hypothetical protein
LEHLIVTPFQKHVMAMMAETRMFELLGREYFKPVMFILANRPSQGMERTVLRQETRGYIGWWTPFDQIIYKRENSAKENIWCLVQSKFTDRCPRETLVQIEWNRILKSRVTNKPRQSSQKLQLQ